MRKLEKTNQDKTVFVRVIVLLIIDQNPGHCRINIYGSHNAQDVAYMLVRKEDWNNVQSAMKRLDALQHYHSREIKDYMEANPQVKIIFLPAYSFPNLNLVERFGSSFARRSPAIFSMNMLPDSGRQLWIFPGK